MKGPSSCFLLLLALACVSHVLGGEPAASAVTCNPMQLLPCAAAISSSAQPSGLCCSKLKEQQPCFCQYAKNPGLQKYIYSANSKKVSQTCGVPLPRC